jgi:hypothetical protein
MWVTESYNPWLKSQLGHVSFMALGKIALPF